MVYTSAVHESHVGPTNRRLQGCGTVDAVSTNTLYTRPSRLRLHACNSESETTKINRLVCFPSIKNEFKRTYPSDKIAFSVIWKRSEFPVNVTDSRTRSVKHLSTTLPYLIAKEKKMLEPTKSNEP